MLLIEFKGISKREFCRQIDVSHTYLNGDSEVGSDKLEVIISNNPELSIEWLLTGKGEMLKKLEVNNTSISEISEKYIKILEAHAETIKSQQQTIASLLSKGAAVDAPGAAPMAAKG